jgi:hypothetical protein
MSSLSIFHSSAGLPTGNNPIVFAPLSKHELAAAAAEDELHDLQCTIVEKMASMRHTYTPQSNLPDTQCDTYYDGVYGR